MLQSRHRRLGEAAFNLQQPGKGTFKVLFANCKVKNFSHSGYPYSVAGIATCSRAATCWTTRWCTRPTESSPSTASPSSAHHSATFTLASPPLPLHFCHRDSGTAVKKAPVLKVLKICLCLSDPCQLYFTFRAFYLQFCSKLHEVSSDRQGILSLCALFENLVSFDISPIPIL